jgi:protein SCO1/2
MKQRWWLGVLTLCLPAFTCVWCAENALPIYGPFPDFVAEAATSHEFRALALKDLLGHPFVADFIYTRCPGPCPLMSQKMSHLQGRLSSRVRLVSFSVDPDVDNPKVLQAYAQQYAAEPRRWYFVRIRKAELLAFLNAALSPAHTDSPVELGHSTQFVLVDDRGRIRGYYDTGLGQDLSSLEHDARRLD